MRLQSWARPRALVPAAILLAAALAASAAYLFLPSVRMRVHAARLREIPQGRWVDAHRYDQPWFDAARLGRVDILQALHDAHYPIDSQTGNGYTATILAAYDDQPQALEYLLKAGADPCRADRNGNTALMGVLYKGNLSIARRLLAAPCPIDQVNNAGETALSFAALFGRLDLLRELAARGADVGHVDARGRTILQIVRDQDNQAAVGALVKLGAR
jgi:uncharacterized protein